MHPKKHIIIRINRGESGFSPTIPRDLPRDIVKNENMSLDEFIDCLNEEIEVTPGQRKAMVAGSMWGWHTKLADPDMYDEEGVVMLEKL